jgi:hypothetical protein
MTFIEVADDAIKIGLGAAIALIGSLMTSDRDWVRDTKKRRLDSLEAVAADFEIAFQSWLSMSRAYESNKRAGRPSSGLSELNQTTRNQITSVESRLRLFGYADCVAALNDFRIKLMTAMGVLIAEGPEAVSTKQEANSALAESRQHFYMQMRLAYQNAEQLDTAKASRWVRSFRFFNPGRPSH